MDRYVGAAAMLPATDRRALAVQALAGSATISDLAAGHGVSRVERPVHDEGVEDEDHAEQGLLEPQRRVLVLVAANGAGLVVADVIVLVLA